MVFVKGDNVTNVNNVVVSSSNLTKLKQLCLQMHLKGMSLREIERATDIHHTTILHWLCKARLDLDEISNT
ncbi:MAG: hypothetical protein V7K97_18890 [Nostoc sp.]